MDRFRSPHSNFSNKWNDKSECYSPIYSSSVLPEYRKFTKVTSTPLASPVSISARRRYDLSRSSPQGNDEYHESPKNLSRVSSNISLSTYTDSRSYGLANRIVEYNNQAEGRPMSNYNSPRSSSSRQFPIVRLFKKEPPVISSKPSTVTIHIAQPDSTDYDGEQRRLILQGIMQNNQQKSSDNSETRSFLDALKEISRKRIHSDEPNEVQEEDTIRKRNRESLTYNNETYKQVKDNSSNTEKSDADKEMCDSQIPCIDPITASLSSSNKLFERLLIGAKRKTKEPQQEHDAPKKIKLQSVQTQTTNETPNEQSKKKEEVTNKTNSNRIEENSDKKESTDKENRPLVIFDDKPLEINRKKKLAVLLNALSGFSNSSYLEQFGEKPSTSVLSPGNKSKSGKHVTFNETVEVRSIPPSSEVEGVTKPLIVDSKTSNGEANLTSVLLQNTSTVTTSLSNGTSSILSAASSASNSNQTNGSNNFTSSTVSQNSSFNLKPPTSKEQIPGIQICFWFDSPSKAITSTTQTAALSSISNPVSFKNSVSPSSFNASMNTTLVNNNGNNSFFDSNKTQRSSNQPGFQLSNSSTTAGFVSPIASTGGAALGVSNTTVSTTSLSTSTFTTLSNSMFNANTNSFNFQPGNLPAFGTTSTSSPSIPFGTTTPTTTTTMATSLSFGTVSTTSPFGIGPMTTSSPFGAATTATSSSFNAASTTTSSFATTSPFGTATTSSFGTVSASTATATSASSLPFGGFNTASSVGTTKPSFSFNMPSASSVTSTATSGTATFTFGAGFGTSAQNKTAFDSGSGQGNPQSSTFTFGPTSTSGATNPFGATANNAIPFGASTTSANPFGGTTTAVTPFGSSTATASPFGGTTATVSPFGGSTVTVSSFSAPSTTATPFGASTATVTPFGSSTITTSPFGGTTTTPTPFGASTTTATPFGSSTTTVTPFGNTPATTTPAFGTSNASFSFTGGFGNSNQNTSFRSFSKSEPLSFPMNGQSTGTTPSFALNTQPAFGSNAQPAPSAFGSNTQSAPPAFGSSTQAAPMFGSNTQSAPGFGSNTQTAAAFGSTTQTTPAFGSTTQTAPAFGSSTQTAPAFGSNTQTAAPSAFGSNTQTAAPSAFGSSSQTVPSAFGAVSPVQSAFQAPFGSTAQQGGFSSGTKTGVGSGFGSNMQSPFGSNSQSVFGSTASQPQPFTFGTSNGPAANASSNVFSFGASADANKPAGPNFSSGSNFPPNLFNPTPNTGMFSIGSGGGSTAQKTRTQLRAARRRT